MCWVALDRLVRLHERGHLQAPVDGFSREREAIRAEIEAHGYNTRLGSYTRTFDGEELDASLLLLARYGYLPAGADRMVGTCRRVHQHLGVNGLLYRYLGADGLPPGEGAFGIASFWAVNCWLLQGDVDGATRAFERLAGLANDVGLLAEEIDPVTGAPLGNFPQAFTHVGLIDAALTLHEAAGRSVAQPVSARAGRVGRTT
jgi:GH15 family glucan-1,4-alpha-glucosidase